MRGRHRHGLGSGHGHHHDHPELPRSDEGIRATKVGLVGLAVTATLQVVVVVFTGSVALLSDTIHNAADALTAIPLWIAFAVGRRPPSRRFTHGYNRVEDLAGLFILVVIAASAALVGWESARRLIEPRRVEYAAWVIAAGLIGMVGNELVARYRMRAGQRLGSAALMADGRHARADALTSVAVIAAGIGSLVGVRWVDPVAGIVVALLIVVTLIRAAAGVLGRILDAVDPELTAAAREVVAASAGVEALTDLRMRWHGHRLDVIAVVSVDPRLTVAEGHGVAQQVSHALMHALPYEVVPLIHIDPHGVEDSHALTGHHLEPGSWSG